MPDTNQQFHLTTTDLTLSANRRYACSLIAAGELQGHNLHVAASVLERDAAKFTHKPAHVNHHWFPQLETLVGLYENVAYDAATQAITAELVLKSTPAADWLQRMVDELIADQDAGNPAFNIGLSADVWLDLGPRDEIDGRRAVLAIRQVDSVDIVINPASDGARFDRILAQAGPPPATQPIQEVLMTLPTPTPANPTPLPDATPIAAAAISTAPAPAASPTTPPAGYDLATEIATLRQQFSDLAARQAIQGFDQPRPQPITQGQMHTPADAAQDIVNWMFGVDGARLPEPTMRSPRQFYHALTGDFNWQGRIMPEHAQFANASTTNLADLAANAMNKVLVDQWPALLPYRWFEELVTVAPNDGSVNAMAWVTFGGISNLPVVSQGAGYTELSVADSKESDPFAKYGGWVGVTEEMWRNNDLGALQAIPRELAGASIRTRSAAIAAIFTVNAGVGPTLDDDSKALFHNDHGSNIQTTALSATAWKAARLECYKQTQLGSSKRLALYPKYALIPGDLWDDALVYFGYGAGAGGYPGTGNNDVNPYAMQRSPSDPRPVPIAVPEWDDVNNWAYLVDPKLHPVLMMSYTQNPGGRSHPMPELFSVVSPIAGMVFTNDVLPIKCRDWWAAGVATWRGVGKRNVT